MHQLLGHLVWREEAVNSLVLGRHGDSVGAHEKAIELGERGAYVRVGARYVAANRREPGSVYWREGNMSRMVFEGDPRWHGDNVE